MSRVLHKYSILITHIGIVGVNEVVTYIFTGRVTLLCAKFNKIEC